MPKGYAHYRFGVTVLPTMPADARRTIQRFRNLFDAGLYGPDIFYFKAPVVTTKNAYLGIKFHEQTGREFFSRVCRMVRSAHSEGMRAYLYGLLCHYALDSAWHHCFAEKETETTQIEMETELDRLLLEQEGKSLTHAQELSTHLQLTPGECETVAKFYPPATAAEVRSALRNMTNAMKWMATPHAHIRGVMEKGLEKFSPKMRGMLMSEEPNPRCCPWHGEMLECYEGALAHFSELLTQLQALLTYNGALGPEFDEIFG